jgi:nicotinamidase-related amidase
LYYNAMLAHAGLGKLFDLPVVLSTSAQSGPNGPLPKAILDMYPDVPVVARQGEVDAWDNPEFRKAIEATGKKQVILAGITTDVCKSHLKDLAGHLNQIELSSDNIRRHDLLRTLVARERLQRLGEC